MPDISCEPNDLLYAARCYKCIPPGAQRDVMIYLLTQLSGSTTDPNSLVQSAACLRCIPDGMKADVITYLLCRIASMDPAFLPQITSNVITPKPSQQALAVLVGGQWSKSQITWTAFNTSGSLYTSTADAPTFCKLITGYSSSVISIKIVPNPAEYYLGDMTLLNLNHHSNLVTLDVSGCIKLKTLDLTGLASLTTLNAQSCNLNSLDLSVCPKLYQAGCDYNPGMQKLNAKFLTLLSALSCSYCNLASFSIQGCTNLRYLNCNNNYLKSIDGLSTCASLATLDCRECQLVSAGFTLPSPSSLSVLDCGLNQLTVLDLTNQSQLRDVWVDGNQLTTLLVSGAANLLNLEASNNLLTALDYSGTALGDIKLSNNLFATFNATMGISPLTFLYLDGNVLTVSAVNTVLTQLAANGQLDGIVHLQGQNPPSVPTGAGVAAITTLKGESWQVQVDIGSYNAVSWTPDTRQLTWKDKNGTTTGNLSTFNASADYATVYSLTGTGPGGRADGLTAISNLSSLTNLQTLILQYASLTALNLTGCSVLTRCLLYGSSITSLDVSTCTQLNALNINGNAIALVANIDAILAALDANGAINGTADISGGTNAAPDAAGLVSYASLQGKGWAVYTK